MHRVRGSGDAQAGRFGGFVFATLVALLAAAALPSFAGASTINVSFHGDANDNDSNGCALREAIRSANENAKIGGCKRGQAPPVVDTIKVEAGRYELTIPGEEQLGVAGDLDVTTEMRIIGKGRGITVDAGGEDGIDDRVFDVANPAAYPIIQNATIRGGHTLGHDGGGIRTLTGSSLKLKDVVIANNHADEPGTYAGGLMAIGDETKLVDVVVKNNEALNVGGLNFDSPGIMRRVTVTGNESAYAGGGVRAVDDLKIYDSTISGNTITSPGGGHGGGGVAFVGGSSVLRNSTISGNSSGQDGGGIAAFGGILEIVHSTITRNTADFDSDLTLGDGGGIWSDVDIVPTIRSSVIANNADDSLAAPFHPDCSGTIESFGFNLVRNQIGCTIGGGIDPDLPAGTDPKLRPLARNGGATKTHALKPSSPLVDEIPKAKCHEGSGIPPAPVRRDQRGVSRPQGGRCDVGSFELD